MPVYLDNNATTPLDPRVLDAMLPYLRDIHGNASSLHRYGRLVRSGIEQAREQLAAAIAAHPDQIVFTSGGTESNNLAVRGTAAGGPPAAIAIGATEHPSLREPALALRRSGWQVDEIPVDNDGRVDPAALSHLVVEGQTRLVSVMAANNETGAVQPLRQIATLVRERGAILHSDATQLFGKLPLRFAESGAHMMTLSAHKLHGPIGAGALVVDRSVVLQPQHSGGDHERGLRAGTENVAAIVGFGKAAELAVGELEQRAQRMRGLREQLETGLHRWPEVVIFAEGSERLPNTVQFGVRGCHGETLLLQLDRAGIAVSSGSACHSRISEPSHVLTAMGIECELALTAIRVSFSHLNSDQDVGKFLQAFDGLLTEFRNTSVRVANAG